MAKSNRSTARGRSNQSAPISSHKLFPPMVALWFAALLGLGSMILPAALLEGLIDLTGIGKAIPSAAPPLGEASRLVVAAALAVLGALLGLSVARRVATEHAAETPRRREFAVQTEPRPVERLSEPRKPLSVHEELGPEEDTQAVEDEGAPRRRALALAEDAGPSEWFHPNLPFSELAANATPNDALQADTDQNAAFETLDLSQFAAQEPAVIAPSRQHVQDQLDDLDDTPFALEDLPEPAEKELPADFGLPVEQRDLSGLDLGELAQRLDLAVRARAEAMEQDREESPLETARMHSPFSATVAPDGGIASYFQSPPQELEGLAETGGDEIWMDESETLADAPEVQERRSMPAAMRPVIVHDDVEPLDPPLASRISLRRAVPVEPDAGKQMFGSPFAYTPHADEPDSLVEAEDDTAQDASDDYSSLLELQNPFKSGHDFVRIEDADIDCESIEPAVVFPGQHLRRNFANETAEQAETVVAFGSAPVRGFTRKGECPVQASPLVDEATSAGTPPASLLGAAPVQPLDPAETERALRLALATLQRISGTA